MAGAGISSVRELHETLLALPPSRQKSVIGALPAEIRTALKLYIQGLGAHGSTSSTTRFQPPARLEVHKPTPCQPDVDAYSFKGTGLMSDQPTIEDNAEAKLRLLRAKKELLEKRREAAALQPNPLSQGAVQGSTECALSPPRVQASPQTTHVREYSAEEHSATHSDVGSSDEADCDVVDEDDSVSSDGCRRDLEELHMLRTARQQLQQLIQLRQEQAQLLEMQMAMEYAGNSAETHEMPRETLDDGSVAETEETSAMLSSADSADEDSEVSTDKPPRPPHLIRAEGSVPVSLSPGKFTQGPSGSDAYGSPARQQLVSRQRNVRPLGALQTDAVPQARQSPPRPVHPPSCISVPRELEASGINGQAVKSWLSGRISGRLCLTVLLDGLQWSRWSGYGRSKDLSEVEELYSCSRSEAYGGLLGGMIGGMAHAPVPTSTALFGGTLVTAGGPSQVLQAAADHMREASDAQVTGPTDDHLAELSIQ